NNANLPFHLNRAAFRLRRWIDQLTAHTAGTTVLAPDVVHARIAVDAATDLRDARDRRDVLRGLPVVRAAELGPATRNAVHACSRHCMPRYTRRLASRTHQPVVLVEQLLAGNVDAELLLDLREVRVQLGLMHP